MRKESDIQKISDLILKDIRQEITEEEKFFLDNWLKQSDKNQELYRRMHDEKYILEQYRLKQTIDTNKAWKQVVISSRKHVMIRYFKYAAAILLLLGAFFIYKYEITGEPEEKNTVVAMNTILPGEGKATLIVSNRQEIQLHKDCQLELKDNSGTEYRNDSSTLYYQATTQADTLTQTESIHTLVIGRGGEYSVQLADGTKVHLNSESKLRYPVAFRQHERRVYLEGEAYFEVNRDEQHPFIVEGKDFAVQVLGTSFNVSNYKDDDVSRVVLLEGSVEVKKANKNYKLEPDESLEIDGDNIKIKKIKAINAISWKNDKFYFSNERLEVVMTKLARWYDVSLFYTNQTIKDYHFTGFIPKYADITKAFNILELTADIKFKVQDRTVVITRM